MKNECFHGAFSLYHFHTLFIFPSIFLTLSYSLYLFLSHIRNLYFSFFLVFLLDSLFRFLFIFLFFTFYLSRSLYLSFSLALSRSLNAIDFP